MLYLTFHDNNLVVWFKRKLWNLQSKYSSINSTPNDYHITVAAA